MGERIGARLLAAAAVALVIGLNATASFAATATTWSVSPGGTVTMTQSGHFTIADTTTGNSLVCVHTNGAGQFKSGSGLLGRHIGTISAVSFSSCTGPGGLTFTMTAGDLPWVLNAQTFDPTITNGLTTGTITRIHATLSGTSCSATVDGTGATANDGMTQIHYHNSLAKLKIRTQVSNLHFYNVTGCASVINSGDAITFSAAYLVSPAQTITGS